jgi:Zn-finger nucleic acid-binding protein
MNCPKCSVPLSIADRQGVEIDFCPQCRGVWLDRGELDKIIERANAWMSPQSERPPDRPAGGPPPVPPAQSREGDARRRDRDYDDDDDYRQGPHGKKKKRGGFFSDLFEFD